MSGLPRLNGIERLRRSPPNASPRLYERFAVDLMELPEITVEFVFEGDAKAICSSCLGLGFELEGQLTTEWPKTLSLCETCHGSGRVGVG